MPTNRYPADGEKRGRGRPRKDEIVTKRFVAHDFNNIKPENWEKYADETIKNARAICKKYKAGYPNVLNIDLKDLSIESRRTWETIFSLRENLDDFTRGKDLTHFRCFENADEVLFGFESYLNYIRENNFVKGFTRPDGDIGTMPLVPNQSNFARWLGVSRQIISKVIEADTRAMNKYMQMLADCLSEGAMVGAYQASSTMFTLKNMCDWADKYEDRSLKKDDILAVGEAEEVMKQLGYAREKAQIEPPKPMLEGEKDG